MRINRRWTMTMGMSLLMAAAPAVRPQQANEENRDQSRGIVAEKFLNTRPSPPRSQTPVKPRYRVVGGSHPGGSSEKSLELGLTVWRLRPARKSDDGPRLLVQNGAETAEWTPERVTLGSPLKVEDNVRVSVESPRTGYLYVVDQEQYADKSLGEPYLIFPTTRTRGGDNKVVPGRLIDIPAQDDAPPYFTLHPSRPGQTGEILTVVIAGQPMEGIEIGARPVILSRDVLARWQQLGAGAVQHLEMTGGAGKAWSKEEQSAAADATRLLTQSDPPPQTIFRVATKSPSFLMVQVILPHGAGGSAATSEAIPRKPR